MIRQNGLSLVELMIALLLSSLLTVAATQLFLVNRQTENLQMGISSVQDNGRFAFDYVSRAFMEAGHGQPDAIVPFILDGTPFNYTPGDAEISDGAKYDQVVFEVVNGRDCLGGTMTGYKRYHVRTDGGLNRLSCDALAYSETTNESGELETGYTQASSGPLIDNVEAFQVMYGVDFDQPNDEGYGLADLYTNATQLKAIESDVTAGAARIVSVRFSVLIASDGRVTLETETAPDSITLLDKTFSQGNGSADINFEDGRLYRTYSSTVALRNLVSTL